MNTLFHYSSIKNVVILFETGTREQRTGNKQRLINVNDIANAYAQQHFSVFLATHIYTGCGTTSAF
jgi:hypothetical protein